MRLEGAWAGIDPGPGGVGGVLVGEADEASSGGVGVSRGGHGGDGLGREGRTRGVGVHVGRGQVRACLNKTEMKKEWKERTDVFNTEEWMENV